MSLRRERNAIEQYSMKVALMLNKGNLSINVQWNNNKYLQPLLFKWFKFFTEKNSSILWRILNLNENTQCSNNMHL